MFTPSKNRGYDRTLGKHPGFRTGPWSQLDPESTQLHDVERRAQRNETFTHDERQKILERLVLAY